MKKIQKASILQRMFSRFSLQHYEPQEFLLDETVVPTTNIDAFMRTPHIAGSGTVAVSASTNYTFLTVPAGKRYVVIAAEIYLSTGTYTFNQITVNMDAQNVAVHKEASGVTTIFKVWDGGLILDQGAYITAYVNSFTGAGNAVGYFYYIEEDMF